jgi:hypothetical protein
LALFVILRRMLLPLAVVLAAFAVGGAVFTAANTLPVGSAGEGSSVVSGFTITSVAYTLNAVDPRDVDAVTYTATADNGSLLAVLTNIESRFDASGIWYTCTRSGGAAPAHDISCDTTAGTQLTVIDIDVLDLVITE